MLAIVGQHHHSSLITYQHLTSDIQHLRVRVMNEPNKCPMGNHPWLATFLVVAFVLCFLAKSFGWLY